MIQYFLTKKITKKITNKLYSFWNLNEKEFIKSFKIKCKNKLNSKDLNVLLTEFDSTKESIIPSIKLSIELEDKIDKLVYELYDLTQEEIRIIEDSLKE